MFCRNCGKEVHPQAVACPACGVPPLVEAKFCQNCGSATDANQIICTKCGVSVKRVPSGVGSGEKSKVAAGILGILLGSLGVHKFYLGYTSAGVIMLVCTLVVGCITLGIGAGLVGIIGLIEGIVYLTKSDEEFDQIYVQGKRPWF